MASEMVGSRAGRAPGRFRARERCRAERMVPRPLRALRTALLQRSALDGRRRAGGRRLVDAQGAENWTPSVTDGPTPAPWLGDRRVRHRHLRGVDRVDAAGVGRRRSLPSWRSGWASPHCARPAARTGTGATSPRGPWPSASPACRSRRRVLLHPLRRPRDRQLRRSRGVRLTPGDCSLTDGVAVFRGTITNEDRDTRSCG